jgi:hypothetical protein
VDNAVATGGAAAAALGSARGELLPCAAGTAEAPGRAGPVEEEVEEEVAGEEAAGAAWAVACFGADLGFVFAVALGLGLLFALVLGLLLGFSSTPGEPSVSPVRVLEKASANEACARLSGAYPPANANVSKKAPRESLRGPVSRTAPLAPDTTQRCFPSKVSRNFYGPR